MQEWRQFETARAEEWASAMEREAVVRRLLEAPSVSQQALREAMLRLRLGRSVVYKLLQRYRQRPQTSSLLPLKRGRSVSARMLAPEREELLATCIRELCVRFPRPSMAAIAREVGQQFAARGLAAPNYRTVRGRVEEMARRVSGTADAYPATTGGNTASASPY